MSVLKETRLAKGFSLTRMAELIGIPISTYAMIESGERSAGKDVAYKVGVLLEVDPNIIFLPERFTVREHRDNETSAARDSA